ncbi:MAG: TIGR04086 family membrane protein [Oscillospiraceae bacterium]|nr:TIGR04086 family membrane protein [Oscillospiraceae bacterium]
MVGIGAALLLLFFCALLSNRMILPEGREGVCGTAALFLAAVLTGYLGARRQKSGKLPYGFAGGAVLLLGVIILAVSEKSSSVFNISLLYDFICITSVSNTHLKMPTNRIV